MNFVKPKSASTFRGVWLETSTLSSTPMKKKGAVSLTKALGKVSPSASLTTTWSILATKVLYLLGVLGPSVKDWIEQ